ncbi:SERINE/THREONINE-PROTEIN KINASE [Salix koriyanagi]|uniref:SERINE/THREONINE-PROTEIN KINASE n=1 Tax=Salix koriyanagi TaxID=2511006 RepID=A0A9Q0SMT6_9ROSI|nr:SERINE/THREONINE-PROTEIN KINASE [Salix koriyanagi]
MLLGFSDNAEAFLSGFLVSGISQKTVVWSARRNGDPIPSSNQGSELFSPVSDTDLSTGIFRLKMQNDGNLVQYPVNTPDTAPYAYYLHQTLNVNVFLGFAFVNQGNWTSGCERDFDARKTIVSKPVWKTVTVKQHYSLMGSTAESKGSL